MTRGRLGLHALDDLGHFFRAQRRRLVAHPDEAGHAGRIAHDVPRVLGHDHLHQDVAGEDAPLDRAARAVAHLDLFFGRHDDVEDLVLHPHRVDALFEVVAHLVLVARVAVDHVPAPVVVRLLRRGGLGRRSSADAITAGSGRSGTYGGYGTGSAIGVGAAAGQAPPASRLRPRRARRWSRSSRGMSSRGSSSCSLISNYPRVRTQRQPGGQTGRSIVPRKVLMTATTTRTMIVSCVASWPRRPGDLAQLGHRLPERAADGVRLLLRGHRLPFLRSRRCVRRAGHRAISGRPGRN